jgi:hypothetical protein
MVTAIYPYRTTPYWEAPEGNPNDEWADAVETADETQYGRGR